MCPVEARETAQAMLSTDMYELLYKYICWRDREMIKQVSVSASTNTVTHEYGVHEQAQGSIDGICDHIYPTFQDSISVYITSHIESGSSAYIML